MRGFLGFARNGERFGRSGKDGHGGGVGADGGGVDPGFGLLDAVVVEEVPGFEVVGSVEDEVARGCWRGSGRRCGHGR
jgi:hypothetical protein